ncbi:MULTISPECIES: hypothetical protein [Bifidobacterium]|uniref:Macrolide ABC transporter ATP-binding protein n=2 Tax=Bifidobacterium TaxID=1678 RepID=A0A261FNI4_9BIFI|nr:MULTISPECIES: hypothetical protein [Bifidobacterium]OZG60732.1 macrolide ABC transporter ATP-binding protein [Bifidobacterium lemurum]OZG69630.1 macrolide ABC transporter ATP-binding protein [Bifidobacterium eulemuris]QOL33288.1 hypothetical protein BE0216_07155 [Bifidobacterium eulemuris]QOL35548.1 hypothetical protein BL8807_05020 [Bifidobacterium lemurum]
MKNLTPHAYQPRAQRKITADVMRADAGDDEWVKTSVSMRRGMKRRLKVWAADRNERLQDVIDAALEAYLQ